MNDQMRSYRTNLSLVDIPIVLETEALWPPISSRYNVTVEEICSFIWEEGTYLHRSQVYEHVSSYMNAFLLSEELFGSALMDLLVVACKSRVFRCCIKAYRTPLANLPGVDHHFLDTWLCALLRGWTEHEQIAHQHLAAFMYHWAWEARSIEGAEREIRSIAQLVEPFEDRKENDPSAFPCTGFSHAVVRGFERFQRPHSGQVLTHGTAISPVHTRCTADSPRP